MKILEERGINKREFSEAIGIKANTMSALSKNRNVNSSTINRICVLLRCQPSEIHGMDTRRRIRICQSRKTCNRSPNSRTTSETKTNVVYLHITT